MGAPEPSPAPCLPSSVFTHGEGLFSRLPHEPGSCCPINHVLGAVFGCSPCHVGTGTAEVEGTGRGTRGLTLWFGARGLRLAWQCALVTSKQLKLVIIAAFQGLSK